MQLWPHMRAWRKTPARAWQPTRQWADRLLLSEAFSPAWAEHQRHFTGPPAPPDAAMPAWFDACQQKQQALLQTAFATIPPRERALATQFSERRWHLLALMARCPGATDLVQANPALAFALASNWVFHRPAVQQPLRAARALLPKKQTDIQAWLGFGHAPAICRMLRKIEPAALSALHLLRWQKQLAQQPCNPALPHVPRITTDMLRFMGDADAAPRLAPRVYHQLAEQPSSGDLHTLWRHAKWAAWQLGQPLPSQLRSVQQLQRWHDSVTHTYQALHANDIAALSCPPPPYPGQDAIQPLRTGAELLAEGQAMRHCVASLFPAIASGQLAIYRVLSPVRATLAIARQGGQWQLAEVKGACNAPIAPEVQQQLLGQLIAGRPTPS